MHVQFVITSIITNHRNYIYWGTIFEHKRLYVVHDGGDLFLFRISVWNCFNKSLLHNKSFFKKPETTEALWKPCFDYVLREKKRNLPIQWHAYNWELLLFKHIFIMQTIYTICIFNRCNIRGGRSVVVCKMGAKLFNIKSNRNQFVHIPE